MASPEVDEWFEAIDCDDEEFVKSLAAKNPHLLDETFSEAQYDEDLKELAEELLGKTVGPLTPLQYACFVESEDSALVLVDLCSDDQLTRKWGEGNNALHLAAFNGLELVLRKLLLRGISHTNKNKLGFRPMDCVANDATRDVFANFRNESHLLEVAPQPTESRPKKMVDKTELPVPKREETLEDDDSEYQIPEYPPLRQINLQAKPKKTSLKNSTQRKSTKVAFDPEVTYFDCCRNGELDLVKDFIQKKKFSPKAKTFLGITVLHMAVESGNLDLVKFLIESGADVNAADADGWTPLHLAASLNGVAIFNFLVEKGANVNQATKDGEYTLDFAETSEMETLIKGSKGFDKAIIEIVANRPPPTDDDEGTEKKSRRKGQSD